VPGPVSQRNVLSGGRLNIFRGVIQRRTGQTRDSARSHMIIGLRATRRNRFPTTRSLKGCALADLYLLAMSVSDVLKVRVNSEDGMDGFYDGGCHRSKVFLRLSVLVDASSSPFLKQE